MVYDSTVQSNDRLFERDCLQSSIIDPYNVSDLGSLIGIGDLIAGGAFVSWCQFDDFLIYKDVLTDGEIKFIYNYQKSLGLERSYFPALEVLIPEFDLEIIRGTDYYTFPLQALEVIS